jgi:Kef-type K+ transport system membrane component KefB
LGALSLGRLDAARVGVGMIPRGEVCLAVARVGLALGLIRQTIYSMVVFVAVAAAALAPPLLNLVFRNAPRADKPEDERYRVA